MVNALMLWWASKLVDRFQITSFGSALLGAIVLALGAPGPAPPGAGLIAERRMARIE